MGLVSSAQLLVNFSGRHLLPAPPAIRAHHATWSSITPRSTAQRHISSPGATATRVTDPLAPALRAPTTPQQETHTPGTAVAAARAERAAEDSEAWKAGGFPAYLQNEVDDFCAAWDDALQEQKLPPEREGGKVVDPFWRIIQREAEEEARSEPLLSSFLHASVVSHDSFARSLAFVLANRLEDNTLHSTELSDIFHTVLREHPEIREAARADIIAFRERDPACTTYMGALLYYKGYHAIQAHRIAHTLWNSGRQMLALALQSRVSVKLAIDIHPGARIGKGLLMDHGTGVVIGETAVVENNVSIMQNVTLGGTGKDSGVRHPHVEANVLLGAGATVLGNITIGRGAQVAANSLVLKAVPPKTMVAGSPAREVGKVTGNPALKMLQWAKPMPSRIDGVAGVGADSHRTDAARMSGSLTHTATPRPVSQPMASPDDSEVPEYGSTAPETATADISGVETTEAASCEGGFADWALNSIEKTLETSSSSSSRGDWDNSSEQSGTTEASDSSQEFRQQRHDGPATVEDHEPWVHKGSAESGAEALARATLRSAAIEKGGDVGHRLSNGAWSEAGEFSSEAGGGYNLWRVSLVGHTMDECTSSDDESDPLFSDSNTSVPATIVRTLGTPGSARAAAGSAVGKAPQPVSGSKGSRQAADLDSSATEGKPKARRSAFPQQTPSLADDSDYSI